MRIYKSDLSRAIVKATGLPIKTSRRALQAIIGAMSDALGAGEPIRISGFGKFHLKTLAARTGRHPRTGERCDIPRRCTVGFKCFKGLKAHLNGGAGARTGPILPGVPGAERRSENRREDLPMGRACVRISGIPVCEFPIKDLSGNGSCILIEAQSVILRNIRIGQEIEVHIPSSDPDHKTVMQRSKITHITRQEAQDRYPGHVLVGVTIIDRLPSS